MKNKSITVLIKWLLYVCAMFIALGCLLFVSGGTLYYPEAWIVIGAIIAPMIFLGFSLFLSNPTLLAERMSTREQQNKQNYIAKTTGFVTTCGLIAGGIDFRFDIIRGSHWVSYLGVSLILVSYVVYFFTFRKNDYLFRTIKVSVGQQLVSTGIYRFIRHPMYLASSLLYAGIAAVLNSGIVVLVFFTLLPLLFLRIKHEETFLVQHLTGYSEYMQKVKYRIIPYVW